jgi:diaminopimelate decarboxylase
VKSEVLHAGIHADAPTYVYDLTELRLRAHKLLTLPISHKQIFFATMANDHPSILNCLRKLGVGVFVNSPAHLQLVLAQGFAPMQIIYAASNLVRREMELCIDTGVTLVLDSLGQIEALGSITPSRCEIGVRLNVGSALDRQTFHIDPDYRFGLLAHELPLATKMAHRYGIRLVGAHAYFGTGLMRPEILLAGLENLSQVAISYLPDLRYLDVGGGFGVPDAADGEEFDIDAWGRAASEIMSQCERRQGYAIDLYIEPGRYLAATCGYFFVKVVDCKPRADRVFVGTNGSVAIFPRPLLYPNVACHPCQLVSDGTREIHPQPLYICGNSTYSQDFLARRVHLPLPNPGETLVFFNAGAYGRSMITHFLGKDRPHEIVLDGVE